MPQDVDQDVKAIQEWLAREPHLPENMDDIVIKKFLHSCYGSLERTKKCIDRFCTTRSQMSEIYTNRDPLTDKIQGCFSTTEISRETRRHAREAVTQNTIKEFAHWTHSTTDRRQLNENLEKANIQLWALYLRESVSTYKIEDSEMLIHQLDDPALEKFDFYGLLKSFLMIADLWIRTHLFYPEGHIIVLDMKSFSLRMLPRVNIMYFRDFILFLLEGMPVRVKKIYCINAPSYYEKLYALVKPVIPAEICDIITFYSDSVSLHKVIDKQYLPEEYGGDAPSMIKQSKSWVDKVIAERKMYLDDNMWRADLKLKTKGSDGAMSGSFRTLAID